MDNPEEILHSLEEFSKLKPKDIPSELEEYLCFVAKTGDPVYQWSTVKSLFREKLLNVISEFYETCPAEITPCPNVDSFKYDSVKDFILERLDAFAAAPFTVQRICELLTKPRKEYNRIDKYMRALEKNILVVSTTEPGNRHATENGDSLVNGLEFNSLDGKSSVHNDTDNDDVSCNKDMEEMDVSSAWPCCEATSTPMAVDEQSQQPDDSAQLAFMTSRSKSPPPQVADSATCHSPPADQQKPYVSIGPVSSESCSHEDAMEETDVTVTITTISTTQNRRSSIEVVVQDPAIETFAFQERELEEEEEPDETPTENDDDDDAAQEEEQQEAEALSPSKEESREAFIVMLQNNEDTRDGDKEELVSDSSSQDPPTSTDGVAEEVEEDDEEEEEEESEAKSSEVTSASEPIVEQPDDSNEATIESSIALPFKEDEDEEEESSETPTSSTATTSSVEIVELNLLEKDSLISSSDEVLSEPPKDESPGDPEEKEAKSDALEVTEVEESVVEKPATHETVDSALDSLMEAEAEKAPSEKPPPVELEEATSSSPDCTSDAPEQSLELPLTLDT